MSEWRVYAATTGRCLAGKRDEEYGSEQERVRQDFASGARLVVNERRREIRGFVPVDRDSSEVFFVAVSFVESEEMTIKKYCSTVNKIIEKNDRWRVREGPPEGKLPEYLIESVENPGDIELADGIDQSLRVGVPGYRAAAGHIVRFHSNSDDLVPTATSNVSVISLTRTHSHIDNDSLIHVSGEYDSPTVLA